MVCLLFYYPFLLQINTILPLQVPCISFFLFIHLPEISSGWSAVVRLAKYKKKINKVQIWHLLLKCYCKDNVISEIQIIELLIMFRKQKLTGR